jgi:hypothetical protein
MVCLLVTTPQVFGRFNKRTVMPSAAQRIGTPHAKFGFFKVYSMLITVLRGPDPLCSGQDDNLLNLPNTYVTTPTRA